MLTLLLLYVALAFAVGGISAFAYVAQDYKIVPYKAKKIKRAIGYTQIVSFPLFVLTNVFMSISTLLNVEGVQNLFPILMQWGYTFEVLTLFSSGLMYKEDIRAVATGIVALISAILLDPLIYEYGFSLTLSLVRSILINVGGVGVFFFGFLSAKHLDEFDREVEELT